MAETLELPNGDEVTPDDVFLYNGYPYRFVPLEDDEYAFEFAPLYWGEGGMDVPFRDREALVEQWDAGSEGTMRPAEWERWLGEAREDPRFDDEEVDALARELPLTDEGADDAAADGGLLGRLLRWLPV